eukprot:501139-Pelagomonas_calceolata.AAC.3
MAPATLHIDPSHAVSYRNHAASPPQLELPTCKTRRDEDSQALSLRLAHLHVRDWGMSGTVAKRRPWSTSASKVTLKQGVGRIRGGICGRIAEGCWRQERECAREPRIPATGTAFWGHNQHVRGVAEIESRFDPRKFFFSGIKGSWEQERKCL